MPQYYRGVLISCSQADICEETQKFCQMVNLARSGPLGPLAPELRRDAVRQYRKTAKLFDFFRNIDHKPERIDEYEKEFESFKEFVAGDIDAAARAEEGETRGGVEAKSMEEHKTEEKKERAAEMEVEGKNQTEHGVTSVQKTNEMKRGEEAVDKRGEIKAAEQEANILAIKKAKKAIKRFKRVCIREVREVRDMPSWDIVEGGYDTLCEEHLKALAVVKQAVGPDETWTDNELIKILKATWQHARSIFMKQGYDPFELDDDKERDDPYGEWKDMYADEEEDEEME